MIGSLLIKLRPLASFKVRGKGEEALYHLFLDVLQRKNQNLTTESVRYQKFEAPGFMGKVVYKIPETFPTENKRRINALADFAFYSGVGRNTTKGMGQVRRKEK